MSETPLLPPQNDMDIRVPESFFVFAPVFLALFLLMLSSSNWSVFIGFEEHLPGTWVSLGLMLAALLLAVPAIRNPAIVPAKRRVALVLSVVIGGALLDERLQFHEQVGYFVQRYLDLAMFPWAVYTDDVIVILFALLGARILWGALQGIPNPRKYTAHVVLIVILALFHGVMDLLAHRALVWRFIWPDLTQAMARPTLETLGYFEESFKLWAEYFVILFLLYFFYEQRGNLAWSIMIVVGGWMATAGLWRIPSAEGVPYLVMGGTLKFLRNYAYLFGLSALWTAWAAVSWFLFRSDRGKLSLAGLFFLWPLVQFPLGLQLIFGIALAVGITRARGTIESRDLVRVGVVQLVLFLVALAVVGAQYMPNTLFFNIEPVLFDTGIQTVVPRGR
jgi:hypothetical protein